MYTSKFDNRTYEREVWDYPESYWRKWEQKVAQEEARKADAERRRKAKEAKNNKN